MERKYLNIQFFQKFQTDSKTRDQDGSYDTYVIFKHDNCRTFLPEA